MNDIDRYRLNRRTIHAGERGNWARARWLRANQWQRLQARERAAWLEEMECIADMAFENHVDD